MGILSAKKIAAYYDSFNGIDITFTKDMIGVTGLIPEQVHLKCGSDLWPCVFFSTSFQRARVVTNLKSGILERLKQVKNSASLRLTFRNPERESSPLMFFVAGRVTQMAPYKGSKEVALMGIQFTQRPPDDFIEIIGRVLDANVNSSKRRDERLVVTPESQRRLRLLSRQAVAFVQKVPRPCIIRDLSFSGAKLIMNGVGKFLLDREATLRTDFDEPRESFLLPGRFVRAEGVEGKQGMVALAMEYDDPQIPMGYKIRINEHLNAVRADIRGEPGAK